MKNPVALIFIALCMAPPASGAMYKCTNFEGKTQYQDSKCNAGERSKNLTVQGVPGRHVLNQGQSRAKTGAGNLRDDDAKLAIKHGLLSCQEKVAFSTANNVARQQETIDDPELLFYTSVVLYRNGRKDEALFWYYAAQLRSRYLAIVDPTANRHSLLTVMSLTYGPLMENYGRQDTSRFVRVIDDVLEWDKRLSKTSHDSMTLNSGTETRVEQVYTGLRKMRAKLLAERETIEKRARSDYPRILVQTGKLLDINDFCRRAETGTAVAPEGVAAEPYREQ